MVGIHPDLFAPSEDQRQCLELPGGYALELAALPERLRAEGETFERLWGLHPPQRPRLTLSGRSVTLPRWQQAYGRDYRFSGSVSRALPVPDALQPYLAWARTAIDSRLNGLLLNWYADGEDYIGPHSDDTRDLQSDSPIVTIALGAERVFRLHPRGGGRRVDLLLASGRAVILSWGTNRAFKHSVPRSRRVADRRMSITLRAFRDAAPDA